MYWDLGWKTLREREFAANQAEPENQAGLVPGPDPVKKIHFPPKKNGTYPNACSPRERTAWCVNTCPRKGGITLYSIRKTIGRSFCQIWIFSKWIWIWMEIWIYLVLKDPAKKDLKLWKLVQILFGSVLTSEQSIFREIQAQFIYFWTDFDHLEIPHLQSQNENWGANAICFFSTPNLKFLLRFLGDLPSHASKPIARIQGWL